jgi:NAD(P)-dependent dehydrogenase (short-subunit alcohol dehydrogenase family)
MDTTLQQDPAAAVRPDPVAGRSALVTGASRGFGRAVAATLAAAGARVVGVARSRADLDAARERLGAAFTPEPADVTDAEVARRLLDEHRPAVVILAAGAAPLMRPLHEQTWESFSENWNVDVAQAFHWTRQALLSPLAPGSTVIAFSSGAALHGSPLSGGYAGANATVRFISRYAAVEAERAGLGIRFASVLPQLTPATTLGAQAIAAYAELDGVDVDTFVERRGPVLTPERVGASVVELLRTESLSDAYLLGADGHTALN